MKTFVSLLTFAASALLTGPSFASDLPVSTVHLCTLHYSSFAYGKNVKSVFAHSGVEESCRPYVGRPTDTYRWYNVQDVPMQAAGDGSHYAGKVLLTAKTSTYTNCWVNPVVQFWVEFEDGSKLIEPAVPMATRLGDFIYDNYNEPVSRGPREAYPAAARMIDRWLGTPAEQIDTVRCDALKSYGDAADVFFEKIKADQKQ